MGTELFNKVAGAFFMSGGEGALVRTLRFDKPRKARRRTPQAPRRGEEHSDESIPTDGVQPMLEQAPQSAAQDAAGAPKG